MGVWFELILADVRMVIPTSALGERVRKREIERERERQRDREKASDRTQRLKGN